jgi:hypothetical protein
MKAYFALLLISAAALCAQSQNPPGQSPPAPQPGTATAQNPPLPPPVPLPERAYVRRLSLVGTITVLGFSSIPAKTINPVTTDPPVDALYATTGTSRRFGYGATAQAALTERFAVSAGAYLRRAGYKMNSDIFTGVDNPNTVTDERTHTVINDNTTARFMDFAATVRYYGKDRHEPGARWFFEVGGALRRAYQISTVTDTTIGTGDTTYDHTPVTPAHKMVKGAVVGAGVQVVDDIGIRVVPGVRYTRWFATPFQNLATAGRRDQLEAIISIGF